MTALRLREYQREALIATSDAWFGQDLTRIAVVLPTGMGKTVIFAELVNREHQAGGRTAILVHRDELVNQTVEKLHAVNPELKVGVVKAQRNEVDADVWVCSVQTLARASRLTQMPRPTLVVVDECHHAAADSYRRAMEHFGCWEDTRAVGFTATLARNDSRGLGDIWEKVVYKRDIRFGIKGGYLADVRGTAIELDGLDLATVARSRGDYQDGALGTALMSVGAGQVIAEGYREHASDRQGVVFAPTVETAHAFADDLNALGIVTETITGTTPVEDRKLIYKRYREGDVQVLSNCMVLTEGWDAPWASCAVIARPTQSQSLYVQMVGRVLRPWPGKPDALVLDVVGASGYHALTTLADLHTTRVEIRPGETLSQAIERMEAELAEAATERQPAPAGERAARDVDLFHASRSVWLQTPGGTWFIPTRARLFFIWPDNDVDVTPALEGDLDIESEPASVKFRVGRTHSPYYAKAWRGPSEHGWVREDPLPLEYAMAWCEQFAEEEDSSVATRNAPWRTAPQPTKPQRDLAISLGISLADADGLPKRKGALSDDISVYYAARVFDRRRR